MRYPGEEEAEEVEVLDDQEGYSASLKSSRGWKNNAGEGGT